MVLRVGVRWSESKEYGAGMGTEAAVVERSEGRAVSAAKL